MEKETDGLWEVLRKPQASGSLLTSKKEGVEGLGRRWRRHWEQERWQLGGDPNRKLDVVLGGASPCQRKPGGTWHQPHRVIWMFFQKGELHEELKLRNARGVDALS